MKKLHFKTDFDGYADNYDDALDQGLAVSGENKNFFANGRIAWLARCLVRYGVPSDHVLDFGCGTGAAIPFLREHLKTRQLTGVDVSERSLSIARKNCSQSDTHFELLQDFQAKMAYDLAYCNGVFHHVPVPERATAVAIVFHALRPGGVFAFWENNPWNPGTRMVMSRIPFDHDAIMLSALEARRLLRVAGFRILRTDFLFYFPRLLRCFRFMERLVVRFPLGAQYQVLACRP